MTNTNNKINPGERFTQNIQLLYVVNSDFKIDVNDVRANFCLIIATDLDTTYCKVIDRKKTDSNEMFEEQNSVQPVFQSKIAKLRKKYNLSSAYQNYLEDFIHDSEGMKFSYPDNDIPESLIPFSIPNPDNPKEQLSVISITPETSLDEIQAYWKQIKSLSTKSLKNPKTYTRKNLTRDLKIFELKNEGKTAKEIAKIINDKYPEIIGYQDVNIIIKRLRHKANKIMGQAT